MDSVPASELKKNFGKYQAIAQRAPIKVTSHGRDSVVMMSVADFERYQAMDTRRAYAIADAPEWAVEAVERDLEVTKHVEPMDWPEQKF